MTSIKIVEFFHNSNNFNLKSHTLLDAEIANQLGIFTWRREWEMEEGMRDLTAVGWMSKTFSYAIRIESYFFYKKKRKAIKKFRKIIIEKKVIERRNNRRIGKF